MKFGVTLSTLRPEQFMEVAVAADELGYESVWLAEHLIWPADIEEPAAGTHMQGRVPKRLPLFDPFAVLSAIASRTTRVRLGTNIYLLALRHPFVGARGFATLDLLSAGRAIAGVGAGWLKQEWSACGLPFDLRGRMLDEAIVICKKLWTQDRTEFAGRHYRFEPVVFYPKPLQPNGVPIVVGGESKAALRRAATLADGWMSMFPQTPSSIIPFLDEIRRLESEAGRKPGSVTVTVLTDRTTPDDAKEWQQIGVDRLILSPWGNPDEALRALRETSLALGIDADGR